MKRKCRRAVIVARRHSFCGHFPLRKNLPSIHHHHGAAWALTFLLTMGLAGRIHKESASAQISDDLPREERIIDRSSCFFPAATPGFGDAAQLSSPTKKTHVAPLRMAVEHVDFGEAGLVPPEAMSRTPPCSTSAVPARRLRSASARTPPRNATSAAPLTS